MTLVLRDTKRTSTFGVTPKQPWIDERSHSQTWGNAPEFTVDRGAGDVNLGLPLPHLACLPTNPQGWPGRKARLKAKD